MIEFIRKGVILLPHKDVQFVASNATINLMITRAYTRFAVRELFHYLKKNNPDMQITSEQVNRYAGNIRSNIFDIMKKADLNATNLQGSDNWRYKLIPALNAEIQKSLVDKIDDPSIRQVVSSLQTSDYEKVLSSENGSTLTRYVGLPYFMTKKWLDYVGVLQHDDYWTSNASYFGSDTEKKVEKWLNQKSDLYEETYQTMFSDDFFNQFEQGLTQNRATMLQFYRQNGLTLAPYASVPTFGNVNMDDLEVDKAVEAVALNDVSQADISLNEDLAAIDEIDHTHDVVLDSGLVLNAANDPTGLRRKLFAAYPNPDDVVHLDWNRVWDKEAEAFYPGIGEFIEPFLNGANDRKEAQKAFNLLAKSSHQLTAQQLDDAINIMTYVSELGYPIEIGNTSGILRNKSDVEMDEIGHWKLDINFQVSGTRAQLPIIHTNPSRMAVYEDFEHKLELDKASIKDEKQRRTNALDPVSRTKLLIGYATGAHEFNIDGTVYQSAIYQLAAGGANNTTRLRFVNEAGDYVPIIVNDKNQIENSYVIIPTKERAEEWLYQFIEEGTFAYAQHFDRNKMDQFVLEWLKDGSEAKLNPAKNELLNAYLFEGGAIREDQLKYIRVSAMLHDVHLAYGMNKEKLLDERGLVVEGEALEQFLHEINEKVQYYIGAYPELLERFTFDEGYFHAPFTVEDALDGYYQDLLDKRIGSFEDGFNANLIANFIGHETVDYFYDYDNSGKPKKITPKKEYLLQEALRRSSYPLDKLLGDTFKNEQLVDKAIQFNAATAKSKTDFAEDNYLRQVMQLVEDELNRNAVVPKKDDGVNLMSQVFKPIDENSDNPYRLRIDDNGIIRWEGIRQDKPGVNEVEVYGEIGQVFAPDENGIIHTNFKGKENYDFAPGYRAYFVMNQSAIDPVENLRLHSFEKQMRDAIRAVVREQFGSQMMVYEDRDSNVGKIRQLRLANKQSALNRMLYSNKTNGVYGEKLDAHALDFEAQNQENIAAMTTEMLKAKAATATQRIHFSKNFVEETNSQAYAKYEKAINSALTREYIQKDENNQYVKNDKDLLEILRLNAVIDDKQEAFLVEKFNVQPRMIIESLIDGDRNDIFVAQIHGVDKEHLFSDEMIQRIVENGRLVLTNGLNEKELQKAQENIRNATTSSLRLNGYQSTRITAQESTEGLLDPYATGQGASQGAVRFLANGVTVDPNTGKLVNISDETRTAIMDLPMFESSKYDPFIRQVLATNAFMHALGVDENTNVMYAPFYGHNFNDAMVVSKNFADRNMVPDEDGVYRSLVEGDKLSDAHGNKGVISLVIDSEWTEDEAKERNLYKEWKWFKANPALDVVASSFAPVSRKNAGIFHEGLKKEAKDIVVPFDEKGNAVEGEVLEKGMFNMSFMILKQTADAQTKLYTEPGEGRKFSGQGTWVAQAMGADELVKSIFTAQAQNKDLSDFREYLLALGLDMNESMALTNEYIPHKDENRKVFTVNQLTDKKALVEEFSRSGGLLKLPFEVKTFSPDNQEKMTDTIAILPPHLRSNVTFSEDGSMKEHAYTKYYSKIIDSVLDYVKAENNAQYWDTNSVLSEKLPEGVPESFYQHKRNEQAKKLEKVRLDVETQLSSLQNELYNKVFDEENNGKHGFLREVVGRKSADRSATAVMTPDPRLGIEQIRIGKATAKRLGVSNGGKVVVWRDPLIKTGGMRMVDVVVGENTGVAVNPTAPGPMGGDFDGDNLALMAVPKISNNKEEQQAFVDRMYRKFGYETNLVDFGSGLDPETKKYSLYLEGSGMDIATAEKIFKAHPEQFVEALKAKDVIDEMLGETIHVPVGNGEVMSVQNDRRTLEHLFETNDAFYQGYKDKYVTAVNTFYREAFQNGYHKEHTYQAIDRGHFKQVTENIVNDRCKGKAEDVKELMDIHYDADINQERYKAYQKEQQYATAVKTDSTGKAGAVAQKLVVLARSQDAFTNSMYSALEASERFTQAVVSLKNKGPVAEKVSNTLDTFSELLNYPTTQNYQKIVGNVSNQDKACNALPRALDAVKSSKENHEALDKILSQNADDKLECLNIEQPDYKSDQLTVGQLRQAMHRLYDDLGVTLASEDYDQVCLLLTEQNESSVQAQKAVQLLNMAQGVGEYANLNAETKELARNVFYALPVNGLKDRMLNSENLFDQLQYAPSKDVLFNASNGSVLNGASHNVREIIPENMQKVYAKSNQLPEITSEMKQVIHGLQEISAKEALTLKETMKEKLQLDDGYKKSGLINDVVNGLQTYANNVKQYIQDVKEENPLTYQQLKGVPVFNDFESMSTYDDRVSKYYDKTVDTIVYGDALARKNDRGLHEFAEHLIENGDANNRYAFERTAKSAKTAPFVNEYVASDVTGKTYKVAKVLDTHADYLVDSTKVNELFEDWVSDDSGMDTNQLQQMSPASETFKLMFGQFEDGYNGDLFKSQHEVLCEQLKQKDVMKQVTEKAYQAAYSFEEDTVLDDETDEIIFDDFDIDY